MRNTGLPEIAAMPELMAVHATSLPFAFPTRSRPQCMNNPRRQGGIRHRAGELANIGDGGRLPEDAPRRWS